MMFAASRESNTTIGARLRTSLVPWFVFSFAILVVNVGAACFYVQRVLKLQPDLKTGLIQVSAPETVGSGQDILTVNVEAASFLPRQGVDLSLEVLEGRNWVAEPNGMCQLSNKSKKGQIQLQILKRPQQKAAAISLKCSTTSTDVRINPSAPFTTILLSKQGTPSTQTSVPSLLVSAPASVPASMDSFPVRVEIQNPLPSSIYSIRLAPDQKSMNWLQQSGQLVELSAKETSSIFQFSLRRIPESRQMLTFVAVDAGNQLHAECYVATSPTAPSLATLAVRSKSPLKSDAQDITQTLELANNNEQGTWNITVSHRHGEFLAPKEQSVTLSSSSSSGQVVWRIVTPPVSTDQILRFTATGNRVQTLEWTTILESVIPQEKKNGALLIVIDTRMLKSTQNPSFQKLLLSTTQERQHSLRGLLVLRNELSPQLWDGRHAFGEDEAYAPDPDSVNAAFTLLAQVLAADHGNGRVVVVWANGSAPSANLNLSYPIDRSRKFSLIWMNLRPESPQGLLAKWKEVAGDNFRIRRLYSPEKLLETTLNDELE